MKRFLLAALAAALTASSAGAVVFEAKRLDVSPAGTQVRVAVGDVDADGRNELVVVSGSGSMRVYSIAANGAATLEHTVAIASLPDESWSYTPPRIIDLDSDGDLDIAVYLRSDGHSGILQLVKWQSGFVTEGPFATPETDAAYGFDMADIDGDGVADAITADHGLNAPQAVHVSSGASGFTSSTSYAFPFNGAPGAFGAAQRGIIYPYARDLNRDGRPDVVVSTAPYNNVAARIFWNSASGLNTTQDIIGRASIDLGFGDQNNDGLVDIVANGNLQLDIRSYRGPNFTSSSLFRVPLDPRTPVIGDFSGDGKPDIALAVTSNKNVLVIVAGSQGGATPVNSADLDAADFMSGSYVQELTQGDLDHDGRTEVIFATDRVIRIKVGGDSTPPVLTLPQAIVKEAGSATGAIVTWTATAVDDRDGSLPVQCSPASGSRFAIGTSVVSCSARDAAGNLATGTFQITVRDTTPPVINAITATPNKLGAPNHKMIAVNVTVTATDLVDAAPAARIIAVTSNEPDDGLGDGDTANDWQITGPLTVSLRAERSGKGTGRIYTILVEVRDRSGNASQGSVEVHVSK